MDNIFVDQSQLFEGMPTRFQVGAGNRKNNVKFDSMARHLNFLPYSTGDVPFFDPHDQNPLAGIHETGQMLGDMTIYSNINNSFSAIVYNYIMMKKPKFIVSPFSLLVPFVILYQGSHNKTEIDIKTTFGFLDKETTVKELLETITQLKSSKVFTTSNIILSIAPIEKQFRDYIKPLCSVVHVSDVKETIDKVNKYVANHTHGKITNVLDENMSNKELVMCLVNVVYFKSSWKYKFDKNNTKPQPFFGLQRRMENLMELSDIETKYFEDSNNQVLELDYDDLEFGMGFILPRNGQLPQVPYEILTGYISNLRNAKLGTIKIPKFKQMSSLELSPMFMNFGLKSIFQNCDISDITKTNVYVSKILHKALIDVDEDGTTATAVTVMSMNLGISSESRKLEFIVNHPFMYYIRSLSTGTIVFIGLFS